MRAAVVAAAAALLLAGASAAPAGAATTYVVSAASASQMPPCDRAKPCDLDWALTNAVAGDDVLLLAGDFALTADHNLTVPIRVHGDSGPRPTVALGSKYLWLTGTDASHRAELSHLAITLTSTVGLRLQDHSVGDDLSVQANGSATTGIALNGADVLLRSSTVSATGPNSNAVYGGSSVEPRPRLLNVTAIATGTGAIGASTAANATTISSSCYASNGYLGIRNSIVRGDAADLRAAVSGDGCNYVYADIKVDHSNYRTTELVGPRTSVTAGAGNQTTPDKTDTASIFADAAFRQLATAPTLDAGALDDNASATDPDGDPRGVGATDIGADELPAAPFATTGEATGVSQSAATLGATVTPGSRETRVVFDYGSSTAYGATTAETVATGSGAQAVAAALTGLAPGTTYHYRVRAFNPPAAQARNAAREDRTFTTPAFPAPLADPLTGLTAPKSIRLAKLRKPGLKVGFVLGRAGSTWTAALTAKVKGKSRRLARATHGNAPAGPVSLKLRGTSKSLRGLHAKRLKATLTITVTAPGVNAVSLHRTVTVKR